MLVTIMNEQADQKQDPKGQSVSVWERAKAFVNHLYSYIIGSWKPWWGCENQRVVGKAQ